MGRSKQGASARWWLRLFAVPFLAVGLGFLFAGVGASLAERLWMSRWVPVPAQVLSVDLERREGALDSRRRRGAPTFLVHVRYRFEAPDGSGAREGDRASLHTRADSSEAWHRELWGRLEAARVNGTPWTVWVDPSEPGRSVADRRLRPGLLALWSGVALIFGGLGAVMWWGGGRLGRAATPGPDGELPRHPSQPLGVAATMLIVFAAFWCVFSLMVSALTLPQAWNGRPAAWLVLLFPAAGVGLALAAWSAWRTWRRWCGITLELPDGPGQAGRAWRVAATLPDWRGTDRARWELRALRPDPPRADAARRDPRHPPTPRLRELGRWRAAAEPVATPRPGQPGAQRLLARLDLPDDLRGLGGPAGGFPATTPPQWLLCLVLERHGPAETLRFPLVLDAAGRLAPAP